MHNAAAVAGLDASAAIQEAAARLAEAGESQPRPARDPVNLPMINNWVEAIGDANPVYTDAETAARSVHGGLVAPPAMAQVWTMRGLHPEPDDDPLGGMSVALDEAGFTSVVATNCEQEYFRYLRHGEQVTVRARLESVVGPKRTSLGEGWFVTTRSTWYVGTEAVASMLFRILKFRPPAPAATPANPAAAETPAPAPDPATDVLRPAVSRDTTFFWDGTAAGELRIQRCGGCGALRHPPGPMWSPPGPARSTATWFSTTPRCRASNCRSWSRSWPCPRACAWSANCSAPTRNGCVSACRSASSSSGSTTR
jgi:hypothetical protein